ncbi:hypothetical protein D3C85_487700 [compost metagenome]
MTKKNMSIALGAAVVGIALILFLTYGNRNGSSNDDHRTLVDRQTLEKLPKRDNSSVDRSRVPDALLPPTNSWLSGMVLQANPKAVYPMPLSFLAKNSGFEIGLPRVTSTDKVISGGHVAGFRI